MVKIIPLTLFYEGCGGTDIFTKDIITIFSSKGCGTIDPVYNFKSGDTVTVEFLSGKPDFGIYLKGRLVSSPVKVDQVKVNEDVVGTTINLYGPCTYTKVMISSGSGSIIPKLLPVVGLGLGALLIREIFRKRRKR